VDLVDQAVTQETQVLLVTLVIQVIMETVELAETQV
jgi:hypothetical protein